MDTEHRSWIAGAVTRSVVAFFVALGVGMACHNDDEGENAGQSCGSPDECYPDADREAILGEIICLSNVPGGYCTHLCTSDDDCCAADGECDTGLPQVCAPFQSTGMMMCFLSCEDAQVGSEDPEAYCDEYANPAFGCRSTGGGNANRKVCA